jgi:Uma2 family endonuclease
MTYEEYWALGELDGLRVEWVDGEAIVFMGALIRHARMTGFSNNLLSGFVRILDLGEVFSEQFAMDLPTRPSVRLPDVFVVLHAHKDRLRREGLFGAADFVMECVSEDSVTRDLRDKRREYEQAGVPEFVAADSREGRRDFEFLRLDANGAYQDVDPDAQGRYHSIVLPGFWIDPQWFWQDPLPVVEDLLFEMLGDTYYEWLMARRRAVQTR